MGAGRKPEGKVVQERVRTGKVSKVERHRPSSRKPTGLLLQLAQKLHRIEGFIAYNYNSYSRCLRTAQVYGVCHSVSFTHIMKYASCFKRNII